MRKKKVTLQEIAAELKVSQFSVSRALSGKPGISDATRELIVATARRMGYQVQPAGRAKTFQDVVVFLLPSRLTGPDYWPSIMMGAQKAVRARGANLVMEILTPEEEQQLQMPPTLERLVVDGIICSGLSAAFVARLQELGHFLVILDAYSAELGIDGVMADNRTGAKAITNYLIDMGHREIGFVGNNRWAESLFHRYSGYREAMEARNLPLVQEWLVLASDPTTGPWDLRFTREHVQRLGRMPTAWACVNDVTALTLIQVLTEMGYRVPDDISVAGFDDIERSAHSVPPLTTVRCHKEILGARCVERLYRRLDAPDEPADLLLVGTELCIRESVKPVKVLA